MIQTENIGKTVKVVKFRGSPCYSHQEYRDKIPHGEGVGLECYGIITKELSDCYIIQREDNKQLMSIAKEYCKILY